MKKYILIGLSICVLLATCVLFASCGGEKTPEPCEVHIDENVDDICDICSASLAPASLTEEELMEFDIDVIVDELNAFLNSGVSLINGERVLPTMNANVSVESNLPKEHWVSRLQSFHIVDGRIKMVLKNNNTNAVAETKDVYLGFTPLGMYCIEDDTTRLNYTTHLYSMEQRSVITKEFKEEYLYYDDTISAYTIDHEYLIQAFQDILYSNTAMAINHDLYDRELLDRLIPKLQSSTSVSFDRDYGYIYDLRIHLYTEEGSMKTDICTITYMNDPSVTALKMSLKLNHMVQLDFMKTPSDEENMFDQSFSFSTECPSDPLFEPVNVKLTSVVSEKQDEAIVISNDITEKFAYLENRLVYADIIAEKYSKKYTVEASVDFNWDCQEVYIYDERYNVYVLFTPDESSNIGQVVFKSIEFDCELDTICLGTMNLADKSIYIDEHSQSELIRKYLSEKYAGSFDSSDAECLSIAIADDEYNLYVLFTQMYTDDDKVVYVYETVQSEMDETTTCFATVNLRNLTLTVKEHNTNHTAH